jgi:RNA polymerase sigma-B factor
VACAVPSVGQGGSHLTQHEAVLLNRYRLKGDQAARDELVERFLPLARALAMRYRASSEALDDLVQVASLGLMKALERFDPDRGPSFQAYAVPTILGELKRHFRDRVLPLHLPRGVKERALDIGRAAEELTGELDRAPTLSEIAARLDVSEDEAVEALQAVEASRTISLDVPVLGDDGEAPPASETLGRPDPVLETMAARLDVREALEVLDERERSCVRLRFVEDMTQEEIAVVVGVSQVHVSRILRRALDKLRAQAVARGLEHAA